MDIIFKSQWQGWFSGMGSGGVILQNLITALTPWIIGGLAIYFAILTFKYGGMLSKAEGPEQRKELKTKLFWLVVGLVITIAGPTIVLILMNTTYKTMKVGTTTAETTNNSLKILTLNIPKYQYNLINYTNAPII